MLRREQFVFFLLGLLLAGCAPRAAAVSSPTPTLEIASTQAITTTPTPNPQATRQAENTPSPTRPTASATKMPTPPAPTPTLPARAEVKGMYGYGQLLPLTCESRSAADWARHFGIQIHEMVFFARLPKSRDPETGFVGSPMGGWGLIPPDAYGVHAAPVAGVLQEYEAKARAVRHMSLGQLRAEIAAGRPVITWVTGHVAPGKGSYYTVDGETITVARYEHTVIVIGYDEKNIKILDGKTIYQRPTAIFLQSWSALGNMAIIWDDALVVRRPTTTSK